MTRNIISFPSAGDRSIFERFPAGIVDEDLPEDTFDTHRNDIPVLKIYNGDSNEKEKHFECTDP